MRNRTTPFEFLFSFYLNDSCDHKKWVGVNELRFHLLLLFSWWQTGRQDGEGCVILLTNIANQSQTIVKWTKVIFFAKNRFNIMFLIPVTLISPLNKTICWIFPKITNICHKSASFCKKLKKLTVAKVALNYHKW